MPGEPGEDVRKWISMKIEHRNPYLLTSVIINTHFGKRICSIDLSTLRRPTVYESERSFSKTLFRPKEVSKNRLSALVWSDNVWKMELSEINEITIITWFPRQSFLQAQIQMSGDCWGFKFLRRSMDGAYDVRLQ